MVLQLVSGWVNGCTADTGTNEAMDGSDKLSSE